MKEKVDVLVATYNGEKYLREQLDSIIKQTYKNIRILISDDCSKDRTQEILQEYEKKDDRIKIFLHDRNLGSNKNFEFLLRQVESKFYMLSDQDDVWLPEKIEKTIQKQKETGADLVFGDLEVVNEKLETIYPSFGDFMLLNRKINKYIGSYKVNYLYNVVTGCTILSTKEFIEKAREEVENNLLENKIIEIIDCYDIEDCKYGIKDILDKHDKILNTSGEKNKEEYITTIKVAN